MRALFPPLVAIAVVAACSRSSQTEPGDASASGSGAGLGDYDPTPFGGARPTKLYVPTGYTGAPAPLLVLLHGYGASGLGQDIYLGMRAVAEKKTLLYVHPDGTPDNYGNRFWNATDACCNFYGASPPPDDSAYLASLVQEIGTRYAVDPKRVYFMGHSNGGFMSYRMACDHADLVAAIVSIAGAMWVDASNCKPSAPVSVLQVHGTSDPTVKYAGGPDFVLDSGILGKPYPGAEATVSDWATFDGCSSPPDTSPPPIDIEASIPGAETRVTRYAAGCRAGSEDDLWAIQGGGHVPSFNDSFAPMAIDFLLAHGKPN